MVVLSSLGVQGIPIGGTDGSSSDPTVIWVTETVWPCEPSTLDAAAAATGTGASKVQKADYDTVPVDGGSNAEAVPEGESESSPAASSVATSDPPMTSASSIDDPATIDPPATSDPPVSTTPAVFYSPVTSDPMTPDPSTTYEQVDAESATSDRTTSDPMTATPVPVFSTYIPDVLAANTTSIPTMPTIAPTFILPSNGTNTTCPDDPEEYTPEEESAYWATATDPSVSYSDYTTTITLKSTSTTTISITVPADSISTSADPMPSATNAAMTTTSDPTGATVDSNQDALYTPVADAFASIMTPGTISADPTTSVDPASPTTDPTTLADPTMSADPATSSDPAVSTDPTTPTPTPTTSDPSQETVSGTIITYIDDTTTITTTSTPTNSAATDITSTTTVWTTSTIIVDSYAKRRRRHVLVTRA